MGLGLARTGGGGGRYRVEHRSEEGQGGRVTLARAVEAAPHHTALDPWASHLRLAGRSGGVLALVDEATGAVVARLHLRPRPGAGA